MGFARAFGYGNITQLTREISKTAGFFWLLTAILFILSAVLFLLKKDGWAVVCFIAIILSQLLIISVWRDARLGTVANIIIIVVTVPALGAIQFNRNVEKENLALLSDIAPADHTVITKDMLLHLPPVVQNWLTRSGVIGKEKIRLVRLKQEGRMRTKKDSKWMSLHAIQYFTVDKPQFVWHASVKMMPGIHLHGLDKFRNGEGSMQIKALSLFNIVNTSGNERMNTSTMIRYLAETIWFPTAVLNDYIKWEPIDSSTARAVMTYKGMSVSGMMSFNEHSDIVRFVADRYMGDGPDSSLETWVVDIIGYKDFDGFRIPYKNKVTWQLKDGDFHWADMELTDLEFNNLQLYK
jgi:hypothetical protein